MLIRHQSKGVSFHDGSSSGFCCLRYSLSMSWVGAIFLMESSASVLLLSPQSHGAGFGMKPSMHWMVSRSPLGRAFDLGLVCSCVYLPVLWITCSVTLLCLRLVSWTFIVLTFVYDPWLFPGLICENWSLPLKPETKNTHLLIIHSSTFWNLLSSGL